MIIISLDYYHVNKKFIKLVRPLFTRSSYQNINKYPISQPVIFTEVNNIYSVVHGVHHRNITKTGL